MENEGKRGRVEDPVKIEVSAETQKELKKIKWDQGLRNMDLVLRELLERPSRLKQAPVAIDGEEEDVDEEEQDDGKTPLPQMMFASQVVRNVKALRYYTGLSIIAFKWVSKALEKAVIFFFFFSFGLPLSISLILWLYVSNHS